MNEVQNKSIPKIVVSTSDKAILDSHRKESEREIYMKYILAVQEAQLWKKRYYSSTNEKVSQLTNIETSLMVLEARLQAERREIEWRFNKQTKTMKEQKRKIEKLTTANQKLLTGLMTLSQKNPQSLAMLENKNDDHKDEINEKISNHKPIANKSLQHPHTSSDCDDKVKNGFFSQHQKSSARTHRSKSLPLNRHSRHHKTNTAC